MNLPVHPLPPHLLSSELTLGEAVAARLDNIAPDMEQVRRMLGLRPDRPAHRKWAEAVDEMAARLAPLLRPRAVWRIDRVERLEKRRLVLESGAAYEGAIGAFLAHSTHVATFISTIGPAVERLARRWLAAGRVMQGSIADALASEAAEAAAQRCHDLIREWARRNSLEVTARYSPGYCGMRVTQQVPLFATLPAARVGVRLTPSCLMRPIKSVSALVGIGPPELVGPADYPCRLCDHPNCMQRRAPVDLPRSC